MTKMALAVSIAPARGSDCGAFVAALALARALPNHAVLLCTEWLANEAIARFD